MGGAFGFAATGRIVRSGPCPDWRAGTGGRRCQRSYEAELAAIFAGIHLATTHWPQTSVIIVRSDCQQALDIITRRIIPKQRHAGARRLRDKIAELRRQVRLVPKWVKGHQSGNRTDAWLNRKVDELAGDAKRTELARREAELDTMFTDRNHALSPQN